MSASAQASAIYVGAVRHRRAGPLPEPGLGGVERARFTPDEPGTYQLIAGMYDERSLQRLAVLDAAGEVASDHVPLHEIVIR